MSSASPPPATTPDHSGTPGPADRGLPGHAPPSRWLTSPGRRTSLATVLAFVAGIAAGLLDAALDWFPQPQGSWFVAVVTWLALTLGHLGLSWQAFRNLSGAALGAAASVGRPRRRRSRLARALLGGDDAPTWSVTSAILSLLALLGLTATRQGDGHGVLTGLTFALVAICWCDVVVVYAEHYARMDLTDPARPDGHLDFPGEQRERHFDDYLYLALGTQATFGTTDVSVTTTTMRRQLAVHSLIAFVFSTVIVAVGVALLSSAVS